MFRTICLLCLLSINVFAQTYTRVGVYANNGGSGSPPISAIPWSKYTELSMFAACPGSGGVVQMNYLTQSSINSFVAGAHGAGIKAIVQIMSPGITGAPFNCVTLDSVTTGSIIATFVTNVVNFVNSNSFDGVSFDWEQSATASQYQDLIQRIKTALPSKVVSIESNGESWATTPVANASPTVDHVNVMCFDMWGGDGMPPTETWYNSSLFQAGLNWMTCDTRTGYFTSAGVPASKILVLLPMYGKKFTNVGPQVPGPQQLCYGASCADPTTLNYNDMVSDSTRWQPAYKQWDDTHKANYLSIDSLDEFIGYTGVEQINAAATWIKAQGFNGIGGFSLDEEYLSGQTGDARYPISTAIYNAMVGGGTAPTITSTSPLPNGTVGTAYSYTLTATGTTPITWSITSGSLPAGLSLNGTTGVISGTPTTAGGPTSVTIQAANGVSPNASQVFSITINAVPPTITTSATLPNGQLETAYSQTLVATGTAPITWSVAVGSTLPSWMSLNSSTGVLSGTPTLAGTSNFSITATNSAGSNTKAFTLTVQSNVVVTVSPAAVSLGQSGTQQFTASLTGTTNQSVTWSPPSQGSISASGLYTAPATIAAQASVTITATSVADPSKTGTATVTLYPPPVITTTTVPSGTVGVMYSQTLVATGGGSPTWSVSSGALPAGLSLSAAGVITGSPTTAGAAANFTVQVTTVGGTATQALSIAVAAATSCSLNRIFVPAI